MDSAKLLNNLRTLRNNIARKPSEYTPEYASKIEESFTKYTNTKTINLLVATSDLLFEYKWAFPFYVPYYKSLKFTKRIRLLWFLFIRLFLFYYIKSLVSRIMRFVKSLYNKNNVNRPETFPESKFIQLINIVMLNLFYIFSDFIFSNWINNPLISNKGKTIKELQTNFKNKNWISCNTLGFTLLDHIIREYLQTKHLTKDITYILSLFNKSNLTSNIFKPGFDYARKIEGDKDLDLSTALKKDFRLVGIALGSFVDIASIYYSYYKKSSNSTDLNRHAALHGAVEFDTMLDSVKLLTFLDLTIRLEPALKILFNEK